ncbi:MAG TPA: DtxR family transcriptional regulator [Candidatus Cloacimonadota bacterium]|jgi:DtxR family Mn-dependent transcriptional regulator|nr:DtxR family transcriptional regulator [Candidatus Cloacimonadota bacterium]HOG30638.1 DtxR family transcriptional regulator [Candidatus Cloacimonadota bacterium]HOR59207.1 DtxR family transcriptional regulator [Candidatus Cloacimonadota bacterium]HQP18478.1 DtxR family transcriptional regulator [Candidatus Cloacimonadota bacterium]
MSEMVLSKSLEDYLEVIYHIVVVEQAAKAKDIAQKMQVKASSVTGALRQLAERDLVNYSPYDQITLTRKGMEVAQDVVRRHEVLKDFFIKVLSIDESEADSVACQMEHAVTTEIIDRFTKFIEFVERCPRAGNSWIKGFDYYCGEKPQTDYCHKCITQTIENFETNLKSGDEMNESTVRLNQVKPGSRVKITTNKLSGVTARRFQEMGLTIGSIVKVERVAPLGDPVEINVKGYSLSLRKEDLDKIEGILLED